MMRLADDESICSFISFPKFETASEINKFKSEVGFEPGSAASKTNEYV